MSEKYNPPAGPPPGYRSEQYAPPPGPPPSQQPDSYAPPPGPPPSQQLNEYAPPPGPPPSKDEAPPPYDPWLAVPDSNVLPPPPAFFEHKSSGANASEDDAVRAHQWCDRNPLWQPRHVSQDEFNRISHQVFNLTKPPSAQGVSVMRGRAPGTTYVKSTADDTILLSDLPLFLAPAAAQRIPKEPVIIYYEVKVIRMGHGEDDGGIAMGFVAPPYPAWRLPGWHRASLAVHGDDGRRYVNNTYGGQEFAESFRPGSTVGIGMKFLRPFYADQTKPRVEVFFTRDGRKEGGWDLWEERDQEGGPSGIEGDPTGLGGERDLLAAVGCFGEVEFEVKFRRQDWAFQPA